MIINQNVIFQGSRERKSLLDAYYVQNNIPKPTLIFSHGYKGFKDWGAWHRMAEKIAGKEINVITFNFSYNGGTIQNPIDFDDLEAFGNNNFSTELNDLNSVIKQAVEGEFIPTEEMETNATFLLGHSRGGGISILSASENPDLKGLITLSSVADFEKRLLLAYDYKEWKENGVVYVKNGRTLQSMPHYYQMYEDFEANKQRLHIERAAKTLNMPVLVIQSEKDEAVPVSDAKLLEKWIPNSTLKIIENTGHTYGVSHPWKEQNLPKPFQEFIESIIQFIKN